MQSLDHFTINYTDYKKYFDFYNEVFLLLGGKKMHGQDGLYAGFGFNRNEFWISKADEQHLETRNLHFAFAANSEEEVNRFYEIAIRYGLKDNGKPGKRPEYHESYYACFVLDDQNNNIECVFGNKNNHD